MAEDTHEIHLIISEVENPDKLVEVLGDGTDSSPALEIERVLRRFEPDAELMEVEIDGIRQWL